MHSNAGNDVVYTGETGTNMTLYMTAKGIADAKVIGDLAADGITGQIVGFHE